MTCSICWWEADGPIQSKDEPNSVNHGYTLRGTHENYLDHAHMYDLGREISYLHEPSDERIALLEYVREIQSGDRKFDQNLFVRLIMAEDKHKRIRADIDRQSDAAEDAMLRASLDDRPPVG